MWCIPKLTHEFIERMMDILELYKRDYNPKKPVICFDEKSMFLCIAVIAVMMLSIGCIKSDKLQFRIMYEIAQDAPFRDPDFQENPQRYIELYTKDMDGSEIQRITFSAYWEHVHPRFGSLLDLC